MPADRPPPTAAFLRAAEEALRASIPPLPSFPPPAAPVPPAVPPRPPDRTRPPRPLAPRQLTAARLLLAGMRVSEVAARLGVDPYTVTRWKRDPRFQAEIRRQVSVAVAKQIEPTPGATKTNTAQRKPTVSQSNLQNKANSDRSTPAGPGAASASAVPAAPRGQSDAPGCATRTNTAQQKPTTSTSPAQNKAKPGAASARYSDGWIRAILAGLPRPGNTGRDP